MRGLRESRHFHAAMVRTLAHPKNAKKGHWGNLSRIRLLWLMLGEYLEVVLAVIELAICEIRWERRGDALSAIDLVDARRRLLAETADVATYGMFLSDNCGGLREDEEPCG